MDTILKVLGVLFLLFIGGCGFLMLVGGKVAHDVNRELQRQEQESGPRITMGQFSQIQNGMTYEQVVQIVGRPGTMDSENMIDAGPGGRIHTVMYSWQNGDFSGMNAIFQNGQLMQKSQFGLK